MSKGKVTVTLRPSALIGLTVGLTLAIAGGTRLAMLSHSTIGVSDAEIRAWKPNGVRLMTRFAKDVSPTNVRPEYPRPQLVRKEWLSLNGLWQFGFDDQNLGDVQGWRSGKDFAERILVPFTFESALSGIGRGSEVHERVWYRRSFSVPRGWGGKRILLNFGAVDWDTTVFLNGKEVGKHRGGYTPFSLDITDALRSGENELVVRVYDPSEVNPVGWQPKGKQRGSEGIWYTRTTGIWQTVWLEPVAENYLTAIMMTPSLDASGTGTLSFLAELDPSAVGATLRVAIAGGPEATATVGADGRVGVTLTVPNARAWTPETPNLYDLSLQLSRDGKTLDEATSYTAFRSVGIANGRLTLNGKPYFYRGVLDQGYWPDGIYTPPTDAALQYDVEMVKKLGFNMARKHVKVEDPRWYYWCDKLGVAVWQDMPSSHNLSSPEARENFRREWTDEIAAVGSYPSIVHWIPFNENWGNPVEFQDEIVELTRRLDPSRPITDASGWTQRGLTDVIDSHNYSDSLVREGLEHPVKPKVVGEYGGVGMTVPNHVWTDGRIYVHAKDAENLRNLVRRRTAQLFEAANLSGYVYTELTDVEQELNGFLTYDREVKTDVESLAKIMRGEDRPKVLPGLGLNHWLVLGGIPTGYQVGATQESEPALKAMSALIDKAYLPGEATLQPREGSSVTVGGTTLRWRAASGSELDFTRLLRDGSKTDAVAYAVAYIDSPQTVHNAILSFGSDDGAVVWLNGQKIHRVVAIRGVSPDQEQISGLTLNAGRNVLVVKVGQGSGGWGLSAQFLLP